MTEAERAELEAFNAYWPKSAEPMPHAQYRRWCDLQVMARDAAQGIEARQGQDRETGLGRNDESPVAKPCAQPSPSSDHSGLEGER